MAKSRTSGKKSGIVRLKIAVKKLQRSLSLRRRLSSYFHDLEKDRGLDSVPKHVKEGHFAVIAVCDDEPKRFIVPLSCLTHPAFLRLLEQAAEEFGFVHEGALTVPCRPSELQRILADQWKETDASTGGNWVSCKNRAWSC